LEQQLFSSCTFSDLLQNSHPPIYTNDSLRRFSHLAMYRGRTRNDEYEPLTSAESWYVGKMSEMFCGKRDRTPRRLYSRAWRAETDMSGKERPTKESERRQSRVVQSSGELSANRK